MAAGDIWSCVVSGKLNNQRMINVFTYLNTGAGTDSAVASDLNDHFENNVLPQCTLFQTSDFTWDLQFCQKGFPLPPSAQIPRGISIQGLLDEQGLPTEVTANVKKRTLSAGRAFRGRAYLPAPAYSRLDRATGLWTAAMMLLMQDVGNSLAEVIGTDDFGPHLFPVIYHRGSHTTTRITQCLADSVPRAQRRRQIGVGI